MVIACKTLVEAVDLLRYCLEDGEVIPSKHFRDELAEEGQPRLQEALRSITEVSRGQLQAIKFSQLLNPPQGNR